MPLKMLKPRLSTTLQSRLAPAPRSGDVRARGRHLARIRERILSAAMGLCQCPRCRASGNPLVASIVDHVVPLWAHGQDVDENRQAISNECHLAKSKHEAACRARGRFEPWAG